MSGYIPWLQVDIPEEVRIQQKSMIPPQMPGLWIIEMDYIAWPTLDCKGPAEYWRYYVAADSEQSAREKVELHVRTGSCYPEACIRRVWKTEALIW